MVQSKSKPHTHKKKGKKDGFTAKSRLKNRFPPMETSALRVTLTLNQYPQVNLYPLVLDLKIINKNY